MSFPVLKINDDNIVHCLPYIARKKKTFQHHTRMSFPLLKINTEFCVLLPCGAKEDRKITDKKFNPFLGIKGCNVNYKNFGTIFQLCELQPNEIHGETQNTTRQHGIQTGETGCKLYFSVVRPHLILRMYIHGIRILSNLPSRLGQNNLGHRKSFHHYRTIQVLSSFLYIL